MQFLSFVLTVNVIVIVPLRKMKTNLCDKVLDEVELEKKNDSLELDE